MRKTELIWSSSWSGVQSSFDKVKLQHELLEVHWAVQARGEPQLQDRRMLPSRAQESVVDEQIRRLSPTYSQGSIFMWSPVQRPSSKLCGKHPLGNRWDEEGGRHAKRVGLLLRQRLDYVTSELKWSVTRPRPGLHGNWETLYSGAQLGQSSMGCAHTHSVMTRQEAQERAMSQQPQNRKGNSLPSVPIALPVKFHIVLTTVKKNA